MKKPEKKTEAEMFRGEHTYNQAIDEYQAYHDEVVEELLEALKALVKAHDCKMGKSAVALRIELAKDAIARAEEKK